MITLVLVAAFVAQSVPPASEKCTLAGQVVNAATGGPLKHVSLRLSPVGRGDPQAARTVFTSSTDAEGKFVMQNVDAGTYSLLAERVGYIAQGFGARTANSLGARLKLEEGQSIKDLTIKLVPQAMIFGKVIDDDGEPVPDANIQCLRWSFINGRKRLTVSGGVESQADGSFVIGGLTAGPTYLSADVRPNWYGGEIERAAGTSGRDGFLKTYFPNAVDSSGGSPIEVSAGAEVRGIEIHMRRGRLYEIRGRVQNAAGVPPAETVELLISPKSGDEPVGRANAQGNSRAFQFKNILAGTYVIEAPWTEASAVDPATGDQKSSTRLSGRLEVTVGDADLENIILPLGPGVEIAGKVKIEGDPAAVSPGRSAAVEVFLETVDGPTLGNSSARASDQGNFRLHSIPAAMYRVRVGGVPEGSYLKSIHFGGEDITGKTLDLNSGAGGEMEIVISSNAAAISGVVRNHNGEGVPAVNIEVYLGERFDRVATTDQNGAYRVSSLAPGDYRIYAWENIEPGFSLEPSFRKNFESRAAAVKLEEKSHESVELKLIPKDDIEAEAAKIR
jgi:protocatechuate 3,4-dioxygenase beta subunit